jgi:hypothetical protein
MRPERPPLSADVRATLGFCPTPFSLCGIAAQVPAPLAGLLSGGQSRPAATEHSAGGVGQERLGPLVVAAYLDRRDVRPNIGAQGAGVPARSEVSEVG